MARSRVFFSRFLSLFDRTESYSPSVKIRRCPYCNTYRDGRNMLAEHSTGCLIHYLAQSYASPLSLDLQVQYHHQCFGRGQQFGCHLHHVQPPINVDGHRNQHAPSFLHSGWSPCPRHGLGCCCSLSLFSFVRIHAHDSFPPSHGHAIDRSCGSLHLGQCDPGLASFLFGNDDVGDIFVSAFLQSSGCPLRLPCQPAIGLLSVVATQLAFCCLQTQQSKYILRKVFDLVVRNSSDISYVYFSDAIAVCILWRRVDETRRIMVCLPLRMMISWYSSLFCASHELVDWSLPLQQGPGLHRLRIDGRL